MNPMQATSQHSVTSTGSGPKSLSLLHSTTSTSSTPGGSVTASPCSNQSGSHANGLLWEGEVQIINNTAGASAHIRLLLQEPLGLDLR
ncbi:unnamed protein product [Protopolystoma xenopodis]|uniref:Uncharacterized protein n=1 Tax=Protopolystoma xenopodis TaxID=117903 RepID=A0A3S5AST7_9PLAT|nr:unnamed protein product [Protopolystoma xenopodis]